MNLTSAFRWHSENPPKVSIVFFKFNRAPLTVENLITKIARILGLNLQGLGIATLNVGKVMQRIDIFVALGSEVAPVKALRKRKFYHCQFPACSQDFKREVLHG